MRRRILVVLFPVCLGACSVLQAKPDVTRSYLLTEVAPSRSAGRKDLSLAVGPIKLPVYLDRAEIVTRVRPNKVELSPIDRWAEPLEINFVRVFTADLAEAIGTDQIVEYPWYGKPEVDYRVAVDVESFEARGDGVAVVGAKWRIQKGVSGKVIRAGRVVREVRSEGSTTEDAVVALSRAVAALAEEVAASILAP